MTKTISITQKGNTLHIKLPDDDHRKDLTLTEEGTHFVKICYSETRQGEAVRRVVLNAEVDFYDDMTFGIVYVFDEAAGTFYHLHSTDFHLDYGGGLLHEVIACKKDQPLLAALVEVLYERHTPLLRRVPNPMPPPMRRPAIKKCEPGNKQWDTRNIFTRKL